MRADRHRVGGSHELQLWWEGRALWLTVTALYKLWVSLVLKEQSKPVLCEPPDLGDLLLF